MEKTWGVSGRAYHCVSGSSKNMRRKKIIQNWGGRDLTPRNESRGGEKFIQANMKERDVVMVFPLTKRTEG